jgi:Family of unknown function (DUF6086)
LSYVFDDHSGSEVWVPARDVGKFFIATAEDLADIMGVPTGLEKLAEDWYRINSQIFAEFVAKVVMQTWHHSVYKELVRGFVAVLVILLGKIGMTVEAEAYAERLALEPPLSLEALRGAMPPHPQ